MRLSSAPLPSLMAYFDRPHGSGRLRNGRTVHLSVARTDRLPIFPHTARGCCLPPEHCLWTPHRCSGGMNLPSRFWTASCWSRSHRWTRRCESGSRRTVPGAHCRSHGLAARSTPASRCHHSHGQPRTTHSSRRARCATVGRRLTNAASDRYQSPGRH